MAVERSRSHPRCDSRVAKLSEDSRKLINDSRKLINDSLELLRQLPSDTFLGRETHKPFPKEENE